MKSTGYFQFSTIFFVVLLAYFVHIYEKAYAPNTIGLAFAYLSMFGNSRELTLSLWEKYAVFDTAVVHPATSVPEIDAKDYTFDVLRRATNNFRIPVVVR
jgi:hypothetical protein